MRFYTTSRLSEHLEITPEGYLLCRDVPVARTGALEYLPEEVPDEVARGASGPTVLVYRDADVLFAEATIASLEGKPVTIDHPDDLVTPESWSELSVGHAHNVRPEEGQAPELLLADFLITVQYAIDLIVPPEDDGPAEAPLREVSLGYDADYEVILPGIGRQTGMIGNHFALVPHGRCGHRCAIRDAASVSRQNGKEPTMATTKKGWLDRMLRNPKVKRAMDEATAEEQARDEAGQDPAEDNAQLQTATDSPESGEKLDEILLLLRSLVDGLKSKDSATDEGCDETGDSGETGDEDPEGTTDEEPDEPAPTKTGDARMRVADAATVSRAGRLAPHLRFCVGDSETVVKRAALQEAMTDASLRDVVESCLGGVPLHRASARALDSAFVAASEIRRVRNNDRTAATLAGAKARDTLPKGPTTPADINAINEQYRASLRGKE